MRSRVFAFMFQPVRRSIGSGRAIDIEIAGHNLETYGIGQGLAPRGYYPPSEGNRVRPRPALTWRAEVPAPDKVRLSDNGLTAREAEQVG